MAQISSSVVTQIVTDYEEGNQPFDGEKLPTERAISKLGLENERDKALFITFDITLNYATDADVIREKTTKAWEDDEWLFHPSELVDRGFSEFLNTIQKYRFRWGRQDAEYWYRNGYTLANEYDSNPLVLFDKHDNDAVSIHQEVKSAEYSYEVNPEFEILTNNKKFASLPGQKVGSLWLQNIHMFARPLTNVHLIESDGQRSKSWDEVIQIPVDVQIAKVTSGLVDRELDADEDRQEILDIWGEFFTSSELSPYQVDKAIWVLGRVWDDGGREYVKSI